MAEGDGNGSSSALQTAGRAIRLSVIVPVFCEQELLEQFHDRLHRTLLSMEPGTNHEIIYVNDGSTDGSPAILGRIATADPNVRVLSFARNFGHQLAITAGLDHATGDVAAVIDADLQDPPEVIPRMVAKWREGFKVVYGVRQSRPGETRFKLWTAKIFYRLLSFLSDTRIPLDSGDFRLLDRAVMDALSQIREESRYIRGLISWIGFAQCPLPYQREARPGGTTKFPLRKMLKFALDGISSFSEKPLRLSSQLGFVVMAGAMLLALWTVIGKFLFPNRVVWGWSSLMVAILFLGGVQLLCIGILGEYIGRIFRQAKGRPLYIVAERINFESATSSEKSTVGTAEDTR